MFRRVFSRNASRKSCQNFVMSCHVSCFEIVQEEPIRRPSFLFENAAIIYSERAFAWKDGDSFDFFLLFFFCSLGQCSKDSIVSRGNWQRKRKTHIYRILVLGIFPQSTARRRDNLASEDGLHGVSVAYWKPKYRVSGCKWSRRE